MSTKAIVIYSGGMDSFTLLHWARERHDGEVAALSFHYGQRHKKELQYAALEAERLGIDHEVVDLAPIQGLLKGSALTDDIDVPEGHYAQDNMKLTVVPNRNMIMLSIAVGWAVSQRAGKVYFGAHAGDHAIYPDCRAEFVEAMTRATRIANYDPVDIEAPFQHLDKAGILLVGKQLGLVETDYARSWTCYKGEAQPCGVCGSCTERLEAFTSLGWVDHLEYAEGTYDVHKRVLGLK
jgi:7-cyano-7-deazaguanine synthase